MKDNLLTIYLAGPMDNCTQEYQKGWRDATKEYLDMYKIKVLDPCRRPHDADLTAREIYELDLIDVKNSDLILADTRPVQRPSWGTAMEIMYAHEVCKIPVIGWHNEADEVGTRLFLDATLTREFNSLDKAIDQIVAFYLK